MATLETRMQNALATVGGKVKELKTFINGNLADLSALTTTAKSSLVAAINEVRSLAAGKQDALGFTPIDVATKGAANGVASLDSGGKVPSGQLPSYVDDVVEYANLAAFPGSGETGKLYIAIDTNKQYRWSGSAYIEIVAAPGSTDSVTEGSTNLYFTDARAQAALAPLLGDTDADLVAVFEAALV